LFDSFFSDSIPVSISKNKYKQINIFYLYNKKVKYIKYLLNYGDWGLGIGDWGLGIGPNPQSPIPNPQSTIPNPHLKN